LESQYPGFSPYPNHSHQNHNLAFLNLQTIPVQSLK
jgi:hypothetical protein